MIPFKRLPKDCSSGFLPLYSNNFDEKVPLSMWSVGFILSLSIIYAVGIIDDLIGLNAKVKFIAQILAASIMPICGLQINDLYGLFGIYEIPSTVGIPLTIFTFVFIDNALNLIDGIDGLATSLSIIALLGFFYCFIPYNLIAYEVMIAGLLGVLVVYLYFNMYGKIEKGTKIFMGDSGSLTLGFFLAFLFVKAIAVNPNIMPMSPKRVLIAYSLLIIPTFDVVRVVLHRIRNRKPIFDADKSHIHHKILAMGYNQHYTLLFIILLAITFIGTNVILGKMDVGLTGILLIDIALYTMLNIGINQKIKLKKEVEK